MKPIVVEQPKVAKPVPQTVFKPFNQLLEDTQFRDKYGFQNDDVSLSDAFSLETIKFKDGSLPEN